VHIKDYTTFVVVSILNNHSMKATNYHLILSVGA